MHAAILCPGPSLTTTWKHPATYDIVICVKRAILFAPCHWWVSGDWDCFKATDAAPIVGYCSIRDVITLIEAGDIIPPERRVPGTRYVAWEDLPFQRTFSMVASLGLAAHLGAKQVDVYGDDKNGPADFDGALGVNRGEDRWAEENAAVTDALISLGMSHGVEFRFVRS